MEDPCLRKSTNPLPVCAPQKSDRTTVGDIIESLIEFNSEIGGKISINMDGEKIEEEKNNYRKPVVGNRNCELGEEKLINEAKQININKEEIYSTNLEESKIVEEDLTISDEDGENDGGSKKWKLVAVSVPQKPNTSKPAQKTFPKKALFKSKEFISEDDSSCDENPEKGTQELQSTFEQPPKKKIKVSQTEVPRKQLKLLNYIPPQPNTNNKCTYKFKNNPRKGLLCGQDSLGDRCSTHKKFTSGANSSQDRGVVDRLKKELDDMRKLMKENNDEKNTTIEKLEKEVESLKQLVEEMKNRSGPKKETNNTAKNTKINKLWRGEKYKLIKYVNNEEALFESGSVLYKLKIPTKMKKPQPQDNVYLAFNATLQKFDWSEG